MLFTMRYLPIPASSSVATRLHRQRHLNQFPARGPHQRGLLFVFLAKAFRHR